MTEYVPVFKIRNPLSLMPDVHQNGSRKTSAVKNKKNQEATPTKLPKISDNAPIITNSKGQEI
jgi:hypothetical protein